MLNCTLLRLLIYRSIRGRCLRRTGVNVSVPLEHREKLQGKCLILAVPTLSAVLLERAHHEDVHQVKRLFGNIIQGVAFNEEHIFVSEIHMERKYARKTGL